MAEKLDERRELCYRICILILIIIAILLGLCCTSPIWMGPPSETLPT